MKNEVNNTVLNHKEYDFHCNLCRSRLSKKDLENNSSECNKCGNTELKLIKRKKLRMNERED